MFALYWHSESTQQIVGGWLSGPPLHLTASQEWARISQNMGERRSVRYPQLTGSSCTQLTGGKPAFVVAALICWAASPIACKTNNKRGGVPQGSIGCAVKL